MRIKGSWWGKYVKEYRNIRGSFSWRGAGMLRKGERKLRKENYR